MKSLHDLAASHGPGLWDVGLFSFAPSFIPKVTSPLRYHGQSTQPFSGIPLPPGAGPCRAGPGGLQIFRSVVARILITKGCGNFCSHVCKNKIFLATFIIFSGKHRRLSDLSSSPTLTERSQGRQGVDDFLPTQGHTGKAPSFS